MTATNGIQPAPGLRPPAIDTTVPSAARRYDYWLGGKDNYAVDRASADTIATHFPTIRTAALENRRFLQRVVTHLTQAGIDQFLDIGTGLPTSPNVHNIAQAINPGVRVVYVDHDPMVVSHARALMTNPTDPTAVAYVQADLRESHRILTHPDLFRTLDLNRPVALLLIAVLHFLDDDDAPYRNVADLVDALPGGSYIAVSHATFDPLPPHVLAKLSPLAQPDAGHGVFRPRTRAEVAQFLDGTHLIEPGLTSIVDWRPDLQPQPQARAEDAAFYGAVAQIAGHG
jgi:O-methyltransferase involved in polyketide biosynthesis